MSDIKLHLETLTLHAGQETPDPVSDSRAVVHSATKFIGGHGTTLGGVIVDGGKFDWKKNADRYPSIAKPDPSYHGAVFADVAGPAAFVTLRIERHVQNALKVVSYLESHPKVARVNHPSIKSHPGNALYNKYFPDGGGSIFTFEIKGDRDNAWKFIDSLKIFSLLANVADVKSLVIHPASTTHSQMTHEELEQQHITPTTIRLSIGVEHIDDIIADLDQAFDNI